MPNQLNFDVEMTRSEINSILEGEDVTSIVMRGNYIYNPENGKPVWEMAAYADGYNSTGSVVITIPICPRPCN
jgi:hypothetical protein